MIENNIKENYIFATPPFLNSKTQDKKLKLLFDEERALQPRQLFLIYLGLVFSLSFYAQPINLLRKRLVKHACF